MKNISNKPLELSAMFPPGTAGNEMIVDIPIFLENAQIAEVKKEFLLHANEYRTINYIYAVDKQKKIKGVASMRELIQASPKKKLSSIMNKKIIAVNPLDTVPHVALLALQNNLKMIPIVDHQRRLVGAYGSQQLLDILNKEFSNDLLRLSGISIPRKHFHFEPGKIVAARIPWMFIGMLGGLATGFIISMFRASIESTILLAVFIPVIMSTGATSANQSAMVFLRNFIHADIKSRVVYVLNELKIAGIVAALLTVVLFGILAVFPGNILLAAAVSISLFFTIIAGALIGVFTPMVLAKLKLDPSIGAGPFLTIVKDLIAMTIYFTISTFILYYFG